MVINVSIATPTEFIMCVLRPWIFGFHVNLSKVFILSKYKCTLKCGFFDKIGSSRVRKDGLDLDNNNAVSTPYLARTPETFADI